MSEFERPEPNPIDTLLDSYAHFARLRRLPHTNAQQFANDIASISELEPLEDADLQDIGAAFVIERIQKKLKSESSEALRRNIAAVIGQAVTVRALSAEPIIGLYKRTDVLGVVTDAKPWRFTTKTEGTISGDSLHIANLFHDKSNLLLELPKRRRYALVPVVDETGEPLISFD